MFIRKVRTAAVVAAGGASLALAVASGASAANPLPHYGKTGVAGYEYTANHALNNLSLVVTPGATFANIGNVGKGGAGGQFCDPNNGYAAQLGLVATSATTESVDYQAGFLGGCADFGVLQNPLQVNTALTNIPLGDSVQIWMSHHNVTVTTRHPGHWVKRHWAPGKWINGHWRKGYWVRGHWVKQYFTTSTATKILFQAQDVTTGSEVFSKTITAPGKEFFDSTGVGVQQDTTGMSNCAPGHPNDNVWDLPYGHPLEGVVGHPTGAIDGTCNQVVSFSDLFANGINLFLHASPGQEWVTSAGGITTNPVLVGPGPLVPQRGGSIGFTIWAGDATT
jgi:hypothetical protein